MFFHDSGFKLGQKKNPNKTLTINPQQLEIYF